MERNFDRIVFNRTFKVFKELQEVGNRLGEYNTNRDTLVNYRSLPKTRELAHMKEIVDSLYPQIAGAVGENLVVNELKKLSDKYVLFNDFTLEFDPPIYNRKEDDRIFSIQVDHLLVTNSGIFVIETKNWSRKSVDSYNLRSPVEQIKRTSYALFVILNSRSNQLGKHLKWHHWGDKQLPIRNLVVMIDNKPNEKFKFVQVKTLKELNSYITYFDPIFDDSEVQGICKFLEESQSIGTTANNH